MKPVKFLLLLFVCLSIFLCPLAPVPAQAALNSWSPISPSRGNITAFVVDPTAPNTVYAGTDGGNGIFKSTDGGTITHGENELPAMGPAT